MRCPVQSHYALIIAGAADRLLWGFFRPLGSCASMHDVHASPSSLVKSAHITCLRRLSLSMVALERRFD